MFGPIVCFGSALMAQITNRVENQTLIANGDQNELNNGNLKSTLLPLQ